MTYLNWDTKNMPDATFSEIDLLYEEGYVATRVDKGVFNKTRSARIFLDEYEASSENRRILRKMEGINMKMYTLPYKDYHWTIHKMAKDFYTTKFGPDTFSANKVKEILSLPQKSTFNKLIVYRDKDDRAIGYCIALLTDTLLHYSYPFYHQNPDPKDPDKNNPSIGLGMMTMAVEWAKEQSIRKNISSDNSDNNDTRGARGSNDGGSIKFVYLGSLQRPTDTYKLQFSGMEWFDGHIWKKDTSDLKNILI